MIAVHLTCWTTVAISHIFQQLYKVWLPTASLTYQHISLIPSILRYCSNQWFQGYLAVLFCSRITCRVATKSMQALSSIMSIVSIKMLPSAATVKSLHTAFVWKYIHHYSNSSIWHIWFLYTIFSFKLCKL